MDCTLRLLDDGTRCRFVGRDVPRALVGREFVDQYAATLAANDAGFDVYADRSVRAVGEAGDDAAANDAKEAAR